MYDRHIEAISWYTDNKLAFPGKRVHLDLGMKHNVIRILKAIQSSLCSGNLTYNTMWLRVTLLVLLIPSAIFALFRYSPHTTPLCPSLFTGARGGGRRARALVNPFIYLFMCHGGEPGSTRGCETRLIADACIEPGIPREDEGMAKVTGNVSGYSTPPSLRSAFLAVRGIYRVFAYSRIFLVKEYKMR